MQNKKKAFSCHPPDFTLPWAFAIAFLHCKQGRHDLYMERNGALSAGLEWSHSEPGSRYASLAPWS